jgi:hypothetical protein
MKKFAMFVFAALMTLLSVTAGAQSTLRIRGTIAGIEGNVLSVTSRDGKALNIHLADNFTVSAAKAVALADIKPGDFVGPASRMGADGKLVAISLQLFPAALRGVVPEGHGPWDLEPGSMMTNATVAALVQASGGGELTLQYKGGSQTIQVPKGVPIFTTVPGDRSLLVPGAYIVTSARVGADGTLSSARVSVSKDGVRPAN